MAPLVLPHVSTPDCRHRTAIRDLAIAARRLMAKPGAIGTPVESRLTPTGQPVELAFMWPGPDYRISLDPCPGALAQRRLKTCSGIVSPQLSAPQRDTLARIASWQRQYGARFGAWLGLRQRKGGIAHKLYLDVPPDAPWAAWEEDLAGKPQIRSSRGAVATMVGLDPLTGGTEIYFSAGKLHPGDIPALATRIGIQAQDDAVPALVQNLTRRSVRFALPSYDMGFSNAWDRDGAASAFTWYSTAVGLLGPDKRARASLLGAGAERRWDMAAYAELTEGHPPRHVLIGMAFPSNAPPAVTATIATSVENLMHWTSDVGGQP